MPDHDRKMCAGQGVILTACMRDTPASAWSVLSDELLTEPLRQPLTHQAPKDINRINQLSWWLSACGGGTFAGHTNGDDMLGLGIGAAILEPVAAESPLAMTYLAVARIWFAVAGM